MYVQWRLDVWVRSCFQVQLVRTWCELFLWGLNYTETSYPCAFILQKWPNETRQSPNMPNLQVPFWIGNFCFNKVPCVLTFAFGVDYVNGLDLRTKCILRTYWYRNNNWNGMDKEWRTRCLPLRQDLVIDVISMENFQSWTQLTPWPSFYDRTMNLRSIGIICHSP